MNSPLYNELIKYSSSKLPFHMPGHKFGSIEAVNKINLWLIDNTEAFGLDNLYDAEGVIKQAMELMADFYGAKKTLFVTNGSTAGILASILTVCKEGEKIIVARNCHHSVWSALVLSGAVPIYLSPEYLAEDNMLGEITPQSVKKALENYPDTKGVILVSPTYEGIVSDIKAISEEVRKHNKILIVDEAHGAHFVLDHLFPKSSIHLGADIVVSSMHKTLPTLTQSSLLHICSDKIDYSILLSSLRMVQTSSPSYAMMGLMDYIRAYILENKKQIKEAYINPLLCIRKQLKELKNLKLIEQPNYDISKIVISTVNTSIDGYELAQILNNDYDIASEAALNTHVILMTTIADNKITLLKLEKALQNIDDTLGYMYTKSQKDYYFNFEISLGISPRKVHYREKEWLPINECIGKVLAQNIILYPPGIPVICTGEVLGIEHLKQIDELKEKLQGIQLTNSTVKLLVAMEN